MFYQIHPSKRILITGANGFIGSALVEAALQQGHEVYAGVRRTSNCQHLKYTSARIVKLDLVSRPVLEQQLRDLNANHVRFDAIIHNAGITRARNKQEFDIVNHRYTRNLAEALIRTGSTPKRFVYMSSLAIYGPGDPTSLKPISLYDSQQPISAYAASKLAAERCLRKLTSIDTVNIRPTAVYGPRDKDFYAYMRMLQRGVDIVAGRHKQLLSFIYVRDLADAVISIALKADAQDAYILSDERTYDSRELGAIINEALDIKPLRVRLPLQPVRVAIGAAQSIAGLFNRMPFIHTEKLNEITAPNWSCDSGPTWRELNRRPLYDLQKGIQETVAWYKSRGWL